MPGAGWSGPTRSCAGRTRPRGCALGEARSMRSDAFARGQQRACCFSTAVYNGAADTFSEQHLAARLQAAQQQHQQRRQHPAASAASSSGGSNPSRRSWGVADGAELVALAELASAGRLDAAELAVKREWRLCRCVVRGGACCCMHAGAVFALSGAKPLPAALCQTVLVRHEPPLTSASPPPSPASQCCRPLPTRRARSMQAWPQRCPCCWVRCIAPAACGRCSWSCPRPRAVLMRHG